MKPEQLQVVSSIILAMMSLLLCLLASRRACASCKSTSCTCRSRVVLPFLQLPCCDLLSPSNTCFNTLLFRLRLSFVSVTSPQARHAAAGLSCLDRASRKKLCSAAYNYLLTGTCCTQHARALTNNDTKHIPAAIIAFQSGKSMCATVPALPPCWEGHTMPD